MQNYKKTLLALMVISAMPLLAATNGATAPIKVTTFNDDDEEDSLCSIREALKVAKTRVSAHGCVVADIYSNTQDIQLEAGEYTLKSELIPDSEVRIWGAAPANWNEKNVLINDVANQYPAQVELKTTIKAENSRIFNTTGGKNPLTLTNLILANGIAPNQGNGGAIYAGGNITLQSTRMLNSKASTGAGGAIYLAGLNASATISNSLFEGNDAFVGSVIAMACKSDNTYLERNISFTASSLIKNGSEDSLSMFEFCGLLPKTELKANTIAQNIANSSKGNLIKFTGDTKAGTENQNDSSILSNGSVLSLTSNTIVENKAFTTFLYDKIGLKTLLFNVLAYNQGAYSCRYLLGDAAKEENVGIGAIYNAFPLANNGKCALPDLILKDNKTNVDLTNIPMDTILSHQVAASQYTAFLPIYYPKRVAQTGTDKKDLVNVTPEGVAGCSDYDQRGLARFADRALFYQPDAKNTCDIGSVELMRLTAGDINSITNGSLSQLISDYKTQNDYFDNLVKNPNDQEYLTYYKYRLDQYKKLVEYYDKKENLKYRAIYIDLQSFKLPLPHEVALSDESHRLDFFSPELYDIEVETIGVGSTIEGKLNFRKDENLVCSWVPEIQQIIVYRKDDAITQDGEQALCSYTIKYKTDHTIQTKGLIKASFTNQAPEAKDTSVTLKYQQKEIAKLNLLELANDAGDTGPGGKGPETKPNKSDFWINEDGVELPIRLSNVPTKNLIVTADRKGKCPAPDQKETCYGGNIYIQEVNAFNPFNYSFNYQVYDNDETPKLSNLATVNEISTATTSDDTRPAKSGGGGEGIFSALGLLGLLIYRRYKK